MTTSVLMRVSLGIRTSLLSKVRSLTESMSMDSTIPVRAPTSITSPTTNDCSPMMKKPLMRFDTEVCDAKPRAIPRMPAAPSRGVSRKPSCTSTVTVSASMPE